ncbi:MAG TPA: hypothetical protein VK027_05755 [Chitinophagaceae bacterium]|nr:hypothetical protein [Chitinophagaceae bacterium]
MAYFVEIQKYGKKYLTLVFGIMGLVPFAQIIRMIFVDHSVYRVQILFLTFVFMLGMYFFLSFFEMKTVIKKEGIYIRYMPIQMRNFFFSWEEIQDLEMVRYKPLKDYWGWGFRPKLFGRERAMTVGGYYGMRVHFKNGETLLIGTQRPEDLTYLISVFRDTNLLPKKQNL